jgi:superfamily II DNA helicase RecQ
LQAEAMQAVLENRDSLVVLPTGGGKWPTIFARAG